MSEMWCANCEALRELDVHGRCASCGSEAVTFPEGVRINWPSPSVRCDEMERFYRLGAV
jgi:Zn finger protein HypA/HybF involved in hydrogenase expression